MEPKIFCPDVTLCDSIGKRDVTMGLPWFNIIHTAVIAIFRFGFCFPFPKSLESALPEMVDARALVRPGW